MILKRNFCPPSPPLKFDEFRLLLQKRQLAEVRSTIVEGTFQRAVAPSDAPEEAPLASPPQEEEQPAASSSSRDDEPPPEPQRRSRKDIAAARAAAKREREERDAEELALLQAQMEEEHNEAKRLKQAEKEEADRECMAIQQQLEELRGRLQAINRDKHELVLQLKQVRVQHGCAGELGAASCSQ